MSLYMAKLEEVAFDFQNKSSFHGISTLTWGFLPHYLPASRMDAEDNYTVEAVILRGFTFISKAPVLSHTCRDTQSMVSLNFLNISGNSKPWQYLHFLYF